jgi:hypothetical protein
MAYPAQVSGLEITLLNLNLEQLETKADISLVHAYAPL